MVFSAEEKRYVESARIARLATADRDGRPNVVPVCFTLLGNTVVIALDEKPKSSDISALRRVRDIESNPFVAMVVDQYDENWRNLGWIQVKGQARIVEPGSTEHRGAIGGLREKYEQYKDHALEERPIIRIRPGHVVAWGDIAP